MSPWITVIRPGFPAVVVFSAKVSGRVGAKLVCSVSTWKRDSASGLYFPLPPRY
jgi:hypothetical protein